MDSQLPPHLQALLTVALTLDGEEAVKLFEYLPKEDKAMILPRAQKYLPLSETDRRAALAPKLKALRSEFLLRQITDVHPSHIAIVLANEPAPIIRIIFHHLPAEMVSEIMKYFPDSTTRKLSICPEPPVIAAELLDVVKHAFIRQFTFILPGDNPLTRLNGTRLRSLLREIGLQTIAIAMRRIDRQELVDSLRRFPRSFSKEIIRRIKLLREVDYEKVMLADRCLVWLNAQQLRNFSLTDDTSLMMLAGAMLEESETLQKFITQKFSLEEAGRFFDLIKRLRQAEVEMALFAREQLKAALVALVAQPRRPIEQPPDASIAP